MGHASPGLGDAPDRRGVHAGRGRDRRCWPGPGSPVWPGPASPVLAGAGIAGGLAGAGIAGAGRGRGCRRSGIPTGPATRWGLMGARRYQFRVDGRLSEEAHDAFAGMRSPRRPCRPSSTAGAGRVPPARIHRSAPDAGHHRGFRESGPVTGHGRADRYPRTAAAEPLSPATSPPSSTSGASIDSSMASPRPPPTRTTLPRPAPETTRAAALRLRRRGWGTCRGARACWAGRSRATRAVRHAVTCDDVRLETHTGQASPQSRSRARPFCKCLLCNARAGSPFG